MASKKLEGIKAIIFDLGDTLYTLPYSVEEYHMKFLRNIFGDDFTISSRDLNQAHDAAEIALSKIIDDNATGPAYSLSTEEWVYFDCVLLENLGIKDDIEKASKQYQKLWDELLKSQPNVLRAGAKEVLEELASRGYKLGVATNWAEDPHDLLTSSGIRHLFQSLQWTLVKGYSKPSPYMLIMNAHEMGINPYNCAFVGNKINLDVEAARRAGMAPILLAKSGASTPINDTDYLVITDLKDLLEYL
ncbi:HAD family hydrolase [Candidatus Thorarchaeota archaeon]|nr:MAG: HAD family hydrolase [Candidatus Thorarchaeota archaeon]